MTANLVNLNGIDVTPDGKTLIAVRSDTGELFRIDPETGDANEIDLGTESVPNGDGILLSGKILYVVQNRHNEVAVIDLATDLSSGEVVTRLTDPDFDVPTTIDELGSRLYAVNAGSAWRTPAIRDGVRGRSVGETGRPLDKPAPDVASPASSGARHRGYNVPKHTGATWFRRGRFSGRAASRGRRLAS